MRNSSSFPEMDYFVLEDIDKLMLIVCEVDHFGQGPQHQSEAHQAPFCKSTWNKNKAFQAFHQIWPLKCLKNHMKVDWSLGSHVQVVQAMHWNHALPGLERRSASTTYLSILVLHDERWSNGESNSRLPCCPGSPQVLPLSDHLLFLSSYYATSPIYLCSILRLE